MVRYPPKPKKSAGRVSEVAIALPMPTMPAGEFKAKCLALMDLVRDRREEIVITKHGTPVAKLVPVDPPTRQSAFGALKGSVLSYGDLISPMDDAWEVESE